MASSHVAGMTALCIASHNCTGPPQEDMNDLRSDAENKSNLSAATPCCGFKGDPNSTADSIYYVYLEYAGGC